MRSQFIRKSDLIYDDRIGTYRLKRKYGKYNRQAVVIESSQAKPTQTDISVNQLKLFAK